MQLLVSKTIIFFDEILRKKFDFEEYTSLDKPTLFLGVYSNGDAKRIINHNGIKIVLLNGSDSSNVEIIKSINDGKTVFIAGSKWVEKDLDIAGVKYERMSFCFDDLYNWDPEPLGDSLYWYNAYSSKYGKKYLDIIRKALPDLNIIINEHTTTPRSEMANVYKKCFAGIRLTEHDGMSQTVAELGLMGRISIWNGGAPCSESFNDVEDIVRTIRRLRKGYNYKLISKRTRQYFVEAETQWAELILRLCGTDELGVTGIFHEDRGRCGSIFRIMRRELVESLPEKFGKDQFERPYISEQLKSRGLKELITSKNSGFVVSEWKGVNNKGYAPGFKDFHTYDKKYS